MQNFGSAAVRDSHIITSNQQSQIDISGQAHGFLTHRNKPPQMPQPIDLTNVNKYQSSGQGQSLSTANSQRMASTGAQTHRNKETSQPHQGLAISNGNSQPMLMQTQSDSSQLNTQRFKALNQRLKSRGKFNNAFMKFCFVHRPSQTN